MTDAREIAIKHWNGSETDWEVDCIESAVEEALESIRDELAEKDARYWELHHAIGMSGDESHGAAIEQAKQCRQQKSDAHKQIQQLQAEVDSNNKAYGIAINSRIAENERLKAEVERLNAENTLLFTNLKQEQDANDLTLDEFKCNFRDMNELINKPGEG